MESEQITLRGWARYVFTGHAPFRITRGERVFLVALQAIDCLLAWWVFHG